MLVVLATDLFIECSVHWLSYSFSACLYSMAETNAAKTAAVPVMIARSPIAWQARMSVAIAHHVAVRNAQIDRIIIAVGLVMVLFC